MMKDSPFAQTPIVDAREYHIWASSIADGEGLLARMAVHSPIYPLGLAALYRTFGPDLWAVYAVQAVLGALTSLLCARTSWNVTRSLAAAGAAGVLAAAGWPFVYFTASALPQVLELFLAAVFLHALSREEAPSPKDACLAGCAIGLAASLRPQLIAAAGAAALALRFAWKGGTWRACLAFALPVAAISFSWSLFLFSRGEPLTFMQPGGGLNLYLGNHAGASGAAASFPGLEYSALHYRAGSAGFMGAREDSYFYAAAADWVRSDPAGAAALWLRKLALTLARCEIPAGEAQPWLVDGSFPFLRRLDFGVLLALGLPGLALGVRRDVRPAAAQAAFFLAGVVSLSIAGAAARYRVALLPILAVGAGYLVMAAQELRAQRRRHALAGLAAGAAALFAAGSWAGILARVEPGRNLGIALSLVRGGGAVEARRLHDAEALLRGAQDPKDWDAVWHLGLIRLRLRDWPGARRCFRDLAEARGRDYPYLWAMLAWLEALADDPAGARDAALAAARLDERSLEGCLRALLYARLADPRFDLRSAACRCPWDVAGRYPSGAETERFALALGRGRVSVDFQSMFLMTEENFWKQFELAYPAEDVSRVVRRRPWGNTSLDCGRSGPSPSGADAGRRGPGAAP